jgi:CDP-glycerol glycerophosphotransferase (TagB/SpsB family)
VRSLRAARRRRSDSGVEHSGQEVAVRTTWRSLRVPAAARAGAGTVIAGLDRLLPTKRGVVVRTFPDFDDQGLELAAALVSSGLGPVTWLVKDPRSAAASARRLPAETSMVEAGSLRGLLAYLRARVVVHTHGLYAVPGRSSRKLFVNLWHGMPVKRLDHDPPVARRQTDVLTVTAPLYAGIIAEEWSLPAGRAVALGLPRNDRMVRAADEPVPASLLDLAEGRPLVVWLPTYRRSVTGSIRVDGRDFSNAFELPGADAESVRALADRLGIHLLVKTHPMAPPPPETGNAGALTVWDEAGLAAGGVTLYELLGHAAALVTDHSSVWVDYLLLDRPVVFSIADMEQYAATRGHYFTPLAEHLPGPVAEDLAQLGVHLGQALHEDPWAARRGELRSVHHTHLDGHSAERVADLVRRRASSVAGGGS